MIEKSAVEPTGLSILSIRLVISSITWGEPCTTIELVSLFQRKLSSAKIKSSFASSSGISFPIERILSSTIFPEACFNLMIEKVRSDFTCCGVSIVLMRFEILLIWTGSPTNRSMSGAIRLASSTILEKPEELKSLLFESLAIVLKAIAID